MTNLEDQGSTSEIITPESFLEALKPIPEYRGPEYWYRHLAVLSEELLQSGKPAED